MGTIKEELLKFLNQLQKSEAYKSLSAGQQEELQEAIDLLVPLDPDVINLAGKDAIKDFVDPLIFKERLPGLATPSNQASKIKFFQDIGILPTPASDTPFPSSPAGKK